VKNVATAQNTMAPGKKKKFTLLDNKTLRAAKRIAYECRSGQSHSKKVGRAWQTNLLDRSVFIESKKVYLVSTDRDWRVQYKLRSNMQYKEYVASESRAKLHKLMKIEAALLARAAKIAHKRAVAVDGPSKGGWHEEARNADRIARMSMQQARDCGAYT